MKMTYALAMAAARDAGDRSMRAAGRTAWNDDDWGACCDKFERLRSRCVSIWLRPAQHAKLRALGGSKWIQAVLDNSTAAHTVWTEETLPSKAPATPQGNIVVPTGIRVDRDIP